MKLQLVILIASVVSFHSFAHADSDFLAQKTLSIVNANPEQVFERTADNPKAIFERYEPKLDSSSKIVSPLRIGGTQDNPTLKVSIRKCVGLICQTVDLDAEVTLKESRGSCDRNFLMQADLRRSSDTLSNTYDRLDVTICYRNTKSGEARLDLNASAHHASRYSGGIVQRQIMDFLQLQIQPITRALAETLRANGSKAPL